MFPIHVYEERRKVTMRSKLIALESSLAGSGPRSTRTVSNREMQRITVDDCSHADGSSELGGTISLQVVVEVKSDNQTSPRHILQDRHVVGGLATREVDRARKRIEEAVRSRRIMGRRTARQTATVLLSSAGGTRFWMLGLFILFVVCCFFLYFQ